MEASNKGHTAVVTSLLEHDAEVDLQDEVRTITSFHIHIISYTLSFFYKNKYLLLGHVSLVS